MVLAIPYGLTWTFYAAAGAIGPVLLGRAFDYFGRLPDRSLDRYFSSPFDGSPPRQPSDKVGIDFCISYTSSE